MRVAVFIVLAQEVAAPVAGQVVPDAVDVIRVVLGVVVLDERDRAVQVPVLGVAVLERAAPGEADVVGSGLADGGELGLGEVAAQIAGTWRDRDEAWVARRRGVARRAIVL
jgi:hypothetical protein